MKAFFAVVGVVAVAALGWVLYSLMGGNAGPEAAPSAASAPASGVEQSPAAIPNAFQTSPPASQPSPPAPSPEPSEPPSALSISVSGFKFVPAEVTVKKGTKVTWTNNDSVGHTVTADGGGIGPDSRLLAKGESYAFTFNTVGTFRYHCSPHPFMKGTVQVSE